MKFEVPPLKGCFKYNIRQNAFDNGISFWKQFYVGIRWYTGVVQWWVLVTWSVVEGGPGQGVVVGSGWTRTSFRGRF